MNNLNATQNMGQTQHKERVATRQQTRQRPRTSAEQTVEKNAAPKPQLHIILQEERPEERYGEKLEICEAECEKTANATSIKIQKIPMPMPEQFAMSLCYKVLSTQGHPLVVTLEQGNFIQKLSGADVTSGPIPRGANDVHGKLTAIDTLTGATVVRTWHWNVSLHRKVMSFWKKILKFLCP